MSLIHMIKLITCLGGNISVGAQNREFNFDVIKFNIV
jgi:hypothetical protein